MAANYQETRVYQAPMSCLLMILRSPQMCAALNIELKSEFPQPNGAWFGFNHGMTSSPYGEKITVAFEDVGEGSVRATVHSECGVPDQTVDWGKNKSNVEVIFNYIEAALSQAPKDFFATGEPIDQENLYVQPTVEKEPPMPCKGLAIASMILGFISIMLYGFLTGILSVIFAIVAKANGNKSKMATTGLVCSICSMAFWTVIFVVIFVLASI